MSSRLFHGMYLKIHDNKLTCYGLGVINYGAKFKPIVLYSELDDCVKDFGSSDFEIIDSQDQEQSFRVYISTYFSMFMLGVMGVGGICLYKKLNK